MSLRGAEPGKATKQSSWIATARQAGLAMTGLFENTPRCRRARAALRRESRREFHGSAFLLSPRRPTGYALAGGVT